MRISDLTQSAENARLEAEKALNPHERVAYLSIHRLFERLASMRRFAESADHPYVPRETSERTDWVAFKRGHALVVSADQRSA